VFLRQLEEATIFFKAWLLPPRVKIMQGTLVMTLMFWAPLLTGLPQEHMCKLSHQFHLLLLPLLHVLMNSLP
jgi:hypothetical protein